MLDFILVSVPQVLVVHDVNMVVLSLFIILLFEVMLSLSHKKRYPEANVLWLLIG
jgi:hypothetical protein